MWGLRVSRAVQGRAGQPWNEGGSGAGAGGNTGSHFCAANQAASRHPLVSAR